MKRSLFCLFLTLLALPLMATTLYQSVAFEQPVFEERNGFTHIQVDDCHAVGKAGEPLLPGKGLQLLLPAGEEIVEIQVHGDSEIFSLQSPVYPAQKQYPLSQIDKMNIAFTQPLAEIYKQSQFPEQLYSQPNTGSFRGYQIASLVIYPVQYHPITNQIEFYSQLEIEITTQTSSKDYSASWNYLRNDSATLRHLNKLVHNADLAQFYPTPASHRNTDDYDYLIITDQEYVEDFQPLADYKNSLGIRTQIHTVQTAYVQATGADNQEKIRNYIINEYENHGITYLLLAGDEEIIPSRGFYVDPGSGYDDDDIPCDLYYTNFDTNWNEDNDNLWGEWNEKDTHSEIFSGRACVDSHEEAQNFVHKQLMYQTQPVEAELTNNLLVGEDLGWTCWGKDYMEEIRLGSSNHGYTTAPIPSHIDVSTLYDLDGIWTPQQLMNELNAGQNLVGHLGHCNVTYAMKLNNPDITTSNFTNDGENHNFYIIYTQGCYCNSFDNRTTYGSTDPEDAISEEWTTLETGPVCFVGNTRYGWGDGSGTNGASQHLHREFYDALYGENISVIGEMQSDSRDDTTPYLVPDDVLLWCFYQTTLLGDPTLDVWNDTPEQITLDVPPVMPLGITEIDITVNATSQNPEYLQVTASYGGELVAVGAPNANGQVTLTFEAPLTLPDTLYIAAYGHNVYDAYATTLLIPAEGPYVVIDSVGIEDGENNQLGWNEEAQIRLQVKNLGCEIADNVIAQIISQTPEVQILQNEIQLGSIDTNAVVLADTCFWVRVQPQIQPNTEAKFQILISSGEESWNYNLSYPIQVPEFAFQPEYIAETIGNGNGAADPGETIQPKIRLQYKGDFILDTLSFQLYTDNEMITISDSMVGFDHVRPNMIVLLDDFTVQIDEAFPVCSSFTLYLQVNSDRDYQFTKLYTFEVPAFYDNFEAEAFAWDHCALAANKNDEWHLSTEANHGVTGEQSWKCGASNGDDYQPSNYAALQMPALTVPDSAFLAFWHKMDAEIASNHLGYAWDGGIVEISTDSVSFVQITPEGGYPYMAEDNTYNPLPEGNPMYSGHFDWKQAIFDLSAYANNTVWVRFVFVSDLHVNDDGWFIDDVKLTTDQPVLAPTNFVGELIGARVVLQWQTPNSPVDAYVVKRNGEIFARNVEANSFVDDLTFCEIGTYQYAIATQYGDEISEFTDLVEIDFDGVAATPEFPVWQQATALNQNYPNPFNPETQIAFTIHPDDAYAPMTLKIYNVKGQLVRTLLQGELAAGNHTRLWNGRNDNGESVSSGLYFTRLQLGNKAFTKKMLLLK